jgi:hypothetical protein
MVVVVSSGQASIWIVFSVVGAWYLGIIWHLDKIAGGT